MAGYLIDKDKGKCYGCEACVQICPKSALKMEEDDEGFRYPILNKDLCVKCNLCHQVCLYENMPVRYGKDKYVFGGYIKDEEVRFESTSGGAFSAIVDTFCDDNYVIFGAESKGLLVWHSYITDKKNLAKFRKSKYSQSKMGKSYQQAKDFLNSGKKVLFSGTPCQISGLKAFLRNTNQDNLLTVEVICEGVPSPLYIRKYEQSLKKKFGALIESIDYRYKGHSFLGHHKWDFKIMRVLTNNILGMARWDFEIMRTTVMMNDNKKKVIEKDRWFNPFWYIWLKHLMSRPSCYECLFTTTERTADISLGDLWGVHIYCPELYGKNGGSSLAIANTEKGKSVLKKAEGSMYGHELRFEDALRYQGPMRKHIEMNPKREQFMQDLKSEMDIEDINRKWADKPSIKLLWQKYVWGNRQKVFVWSIWNRK